MSQDLVDDIQSSTSRGEPPHATVDNYPQQEFSSLGCDRTSSLASQLASTPISPSAAQPLPPNPQNQLCIPTSLTAFIEVQQQAQLKSHSRFESEKTEAENLPEEQLSSVSGQKSSRLDAPAPLLPVRSNTPASLSLSTPHRKLHSDIVVETNGETGRRRDGEKMNLLRMNATSYQPETSLPVTSKIQISSTPESETVPRENSSGQATPPEDLELGNLRLRESEEGADPELGNLRLRELAEPPLPSQPTVYLQGRFGYFRSNNLFLGVDPIDDGLFATGLRLVAAPSIGPQTTVFAGVGGNLIRYGNESQYDYNELRFDAGVRQQINQRTYGEVGWINRQLFDKKEGDRFLNDHSLYLALGRRDSLAKRLNLDTYYQFRISFADPSNRSQAINSLGASLGYDVSSSLQASLDYEFSIADFTQRDRLDQYHQVIGRLTYTLSRNSRLYVFGGRSFGDSSASEIDFDGFVFGAGVNLNLALF